MYQTIEKQETFELTEKKSKFIANLIYVKSKQEAERKSEIIRTRLWFQDSGSGGY